MALHFLHRRDRLKRSKSFWGFVLPMLLAVLSCGRKDAASTPAEPPPQTGSLAISVTGLPAGLATSILVSGPGGFSRSLTAPGTLTGLTAGAYTVSAARVQQDVASYDATPATQQATVAAGGATSAAVSYAVVPGSLAVAVSGLPNGVAPAIMIAGPGGFARTVANAGTMDGLVPGAYSVTALPVAGLGHTFAPLVPTMNIAVASGATPIATVSWTLATGALNVSVTGLPNGTPGAISVLGPGGYTRAITASETITNLAPGDYSVTAASVTVSSDSYAPSITATTVTVQSSFSPVSSQVGYALASGRLAVVLSGVPVGSTPAVQVTGPGGYSATLSVTQTLTNLKAGSYTVAASMVTSGSHLYAPTPAAQSATVTASLTPSAATVSYVLASGAMSITVSGLPIGAAASITVTGPAGFQQAVTGTGLLIGLKPGSYTVTTGAVVSGTSSYAGNPPSQVVSVPASMSAVPVAVNYVAGGGAITVSLNGLPNGVNASVRVTGPAGFNQTLTASAVLPALVAGTYTITGNAVTQGSSNYTAVPPTQTVSLVAGTAATASVTYTLAAAGLNLLIDGMYLVQAVQTYAGSVPLVANRDAFLRVFVKATQSNSVTPTVRVRIYSGAMLLNTITINAPGSSVPTTIDQSTLGNSYNATVAASLLQPGVSLLADVDPTNTVSESSESDNSFPSSGTPQSLDVRAVSTMTMRMVPVAQSANGLTGNVTAGNKDSFLTFLKRLYPIGATDIDVRAPYTTSAPALVSDDANGAWLQILSELNALRSADASLRYYYGVVKVSYSSGIAGLGYLPGRAAMGWDHLPSGDEVLSHELGHNFGRAHAPCGGAGNTDPAYPYAGGAIGAYGYDLTNNSLKLPTQPDIMGYCSNDWISDYNYNAVLAYRQANPSVATLVAARPGILVWGHIHRGQVTLEPVFDVIAPPSLPPRRGNHHVIATSDAGETLFDYQFEGDSIADAADPADRSFAFVIPRDALNGRTLARLRAAAPQSRAEWNDAPAAARRPLVRDATDLPRAVPAGSSSVRVTWNAGELPGVLIRDARTGEILTFGRGGSATLQTTARDFDVVMSNGVRSEQHRVTVH